MSFKSAYDGVNLRDQKTRVVSYLKALFETEDSAHDNGLEDAFGPLIQAGVDGERAALVIGYFRSVMEEINAAPLLVEEAVTRFHELGLLIVSHSEKYAQSQVTAQKKKDTQSKPDAAAKKASETSVANQSIRVSVHLLEDLMNMVSELVLTRNQLMQISRRSGDSEFTVPLQRLSQCTTELQEGVMKTRMQPIGNAWAKLPRIIRDLQVDLGKKIDLQMLGADTELDRQVLELIKDPLTHMVRNSADHGLEMPEERIAAGKPEVGVVRLNAYHEGGHIIIEITDDGRGLNIEKIKQKALANEVVTEAELADLTDQQIQRFIFHPGFSTAEKVTSVSGRGVGMDVVRSNIEKIGGTVDLKSTEGRGSSFIIKIPLTLAIVSALIVKSSDERFAIPQISVLELVRASKDSEYKIEHINATPVLRLRDRLLPLVYLRDVLGAESDEEEDANREEFIVVTQVGGFTYGIVVDQVFDTEEIVVKPVAPLLRDLSIYSGNTILGDGSVIMILDPNGIAAETSDVMSENEHVSETELMADTLSSNRETLLVFRVADDGGQHAVPLSLVARLEEIDVESIETSDGRPVVQYRGKLMPLVKLNDGYDMKESGRQPVLVFSDGDSSMGLVVNEIVDILEDQMNIELASEIQGIVGTAIIGGKATEIIDVAHYMAEVFGGLGGFQSAENEAALAKKKSNVLLIDDSAFFLNMLKPLLSAAGYRVTAVDNAQEALSLRDQGYDFDVIVSDIEMPEMDGFAFAEAVKQQDNRWADVPLVALSSRTNTQDFDRGGQVGFNDYVAKLDKDMLLSALDEMLAESEDAA
ncbi:MAG: hybrid sensor histidine kinase/response regulator [Kordiimonas sp.]|nr:hybrid sensor histidine kinase/response regulator [Kordiimonas sp.]